MGADADWWSRQPVASSGFRQSGGGCPASPGASWRSSFGPGQELGEPDQVIGCHREGELPSDAAEPAVPRLAELGRSLGPAEGLLDPLPDRLADPVAGVAGGASIEGGAARLRGDVRGDVEGAKLADEVLGVVALVGAERNPARGSIMCRAATRSAWPSARVRQASTTRPLRFSMSAWPRKPSLASRPGPLRTRRASGSVMLACVRCCGARRG